MNVIYLFKYLFALQIIMKNIIQKKNLVVVVITVNVLKIVVCVLDVLKRENLVAQIYVKIKYV